MASRKKPAAKGAKKPARKPGRPSKYTEELANTICARIAGGESLIAICRTEGMPVRDTVHRWVLENPVFSDKYAQARDMQAEFYAEEIIEIADDSSQDMTEDANGNERVDYDHIARSRLRVDARKWYASKVAPKKWGDKIQHGGAEDLPAIKQQVDVTMSPADAYKATLG